MTVGRATLALVAAAMTRGALATATATETASAALGDRRRLEGGSGGSEGYNFMFYFVIGAMMLTCLIYNIFFKRKMEAGFLRQQALPETMLRQDVIARCGFYELGGGLCGRRLTRWGRAATKR